MIAGFHVYDATQSLGGAYVLTVRLTGPPAQLHGSLRIHTSLGDHLVDRQLVGSRGLGEIVGQVGIAEVLEIAFGAGLARLAFPALGGWTPGDLHQQVIHSLASKVDTIPMIRSRTSGCFFSSACRRDTRSFLALL
ncbi:hypothetical protein SDC9_129051 [bioreactor metagenome]|uniref:Uncharacterized protein n=1 Tax=bioreactor metagenome TaxID=1076179 RepID=A0A645CYP6_9ZZZZ